MAADYFGIRGEIQGLAEVVATLKGLPAKLQRKIMRKALSKATKGTVAAARRLVPRETGLLKKSIGRKVVTYKESGVLVVVIGPRKGFRQDVTRRGRGKPSIADPVNYAHLVEFGTKPHSLLKGASSRGRLKKATADLVARGIGKIHPGAKARPFLRPAFDQTKGQILQIFAEEVQKGLAAEMAKGVK